MQLDFSKYRGQWHMCDEDDESFGMQSCCLELWTMVSCIGYVVVKGQIRNTLVLYQPRFPV